MGVHTTAVISLSLYLVSAAAYLTSLFRGEKGRGRWGRRALIAALIAHTALLLLLLLDGMLLIPETRGDYFFWISWALPVLFLVAGPKYNYPIFGAFLAPMTVLFLGSSSFLAHKPSTPRPWSYALSLIHEVPALIAEISLLVALIASSIFLIQERRIKLKGSTALFLYGPSLDLLEKLNYRAVIVGFIAMTFAVLSGTMWALSQGKSVLVNDYYQWVSILVWALLVFILHLRLIKKCSPAEVSRLTLVVTVVFFISFFALLFITGSFSHGSLYT